VHFRRSTALALAVSFLTACTSHGQPAPPPSTRVPTTTIASQTSPTPSPSRTGPLLTGPGVRPGETPPQLGPLQSRHDSSGALAFAAFYYRAYDWSVATNDSYLLRQVSLPSCTACERAIRLFDELAQKRQVLRGGRIVLRSAQLITGRFTVRSDLVVEVKSHQDALTLESSATAPTPVAEAEDDDSFVFVSWVGAGWKIVEIGAPS
jgi:hypothetical protein